MPTNFVDTHQVGLGIVAAEQLGIVEVPTVTQQSTEGFYLDVNDPRNHPSFPHDMQFLPQQQTICPLCHR
jgi:hypothetical protein